MDNISDFTWKVTTLDGKVSYKVIAANPDKAKILAAQAFLKKYPIPVTKTDLAPLFLCISSKNLSGTGGKPKALRYKQWEKLVSTYSLEDLDDTEETIIQQEQEKKVQKRRGLMNKIRTTKNGHQILTYADEANKPTEKILEERQKMVQDWIRGRLGYGQRN